MPPPAANNKPNRKALKVRREKIRTKKKLSGSVQKHKTQVAALVARNPKRERKLGKRKAALERLALASAAAAETETMTDAKPRKPKTKKKGRSAGVEAMQE